MPKHIKCPDGGNLTVGETFDWENESNRPHTITGCSAFLTQSSYTVPAASNGTAGTVSATVRSDITAGNYTYSDGANIAATNPTIHVSSGPVP